jgi:hypothetical protein
MDRWTLRTSIILLELQWEHKAPIVHNFTNKLKDNFPSGNFLKSCSADYEIPYSLTFLTMFIKSRHLGLYLVRWHKFTISYLISLISTQILFSHLQLDNSLPTTDVLSSLMHAVCPTHLILLDLVTLILLLKSKHAHVLLSSLFSEREQCFAPA